MGSEADNLLAEFSLLDFRRIMRGLASPKEDGEHKQAVMALTRIFGPSTVSLLICFLVLGGLFTLVARKTIVQSRAVEVTMMDPETVKLDEIKDLMKEIEIQPVDPPPIDNMQNFTDVPILAPPSEAPMVSEQTMELAAPVPVLTKSPLIMRNLYGNRMSSASRAGAMKAYRGTGKGEDAVLRALRWLKKKQDPDGSWKTASDVDHVAMTGLALLTFLAHGETPQSPEFGPTVEKAIRWMIDFQAKDPSGKFSQNSYTHGICTYAISEAYALTKIMAVKEAMEKALVFLLRGQQNQGGFHYGYARGDKFDTSVAGWNIQALKAATMAGSSNTNLPGAVAKAIMFLKTQSYAQNGSGFVYQGTPGQPSPTGGRWTMTGVGTLCMQLLGRAKDAETKQGIVCLEPLTCVWPSGKDAKASVYGWYYVTQAKFQQGDSTWNAWNSQFNKQFTDSQIREEDGCGYWPNGDHGGAVYTTCLATLSLEVYYRYLPTYKKAEDTETVSAAASDDVKIEIL
jgi:hypothetical protein